MPEFGIIWEVPKKPSIDDALADVRLQARADGILIPEDAEPTIAEHLPSDRNPNGSLDVIFEWDGRSTPDPRRWKAVKARTPGATAKQLGERPR